MIWRKNLQIIHFSNAVVATVRQIALFLLISLHHFHRFTAQNDVAPEKLALRHQQR